MSIDPFDFSREGFEKRKSIVEAATYRSRKEGLEAVARNTDETGIVGEIKYEDKTTYGQSGLGSTYRVWKKWDGEKWNTIKGADNIKAAELQYAYAAWLSTPAAMNAAAGIEPPEVKYPPKNDGGGSGVEPEPVNQDPTYGNEAVDLQRSGWESDNTNLRYPFERMESTQDYIQFSIIEYKRAGRTGGPVGTGQANQGTGVFKKALNANILGTVTLPVPSQIGDNNGADYGSGNLNFLQEAGLGVASDVIAGNQEGLRSAGARIKNLIGTISGNSNNLVNNFFANQAVGAFGGNLDFNQLLARSSGVIINPNMELLFTGPKLRSFTFAFKFTPRFSDEAEEVRQIIRAFKKHSSPRSNGIFLKTPEIFQIRYLGQGSRNHGFLNRFKLCALTNMTVNYTGDGVYATYSDGTPVSMIMTLTFNELTPVYAEDYNENVGGVGY